MIKIFIIEDDEIVAEIYKGKLQAEGYRVEVAHDGKSGYLRLLTFEPDLLSLDMMIPELSGHMQTDKRLSRIPVLIMTGEQSMTLQAESFSAGAAIFLPKPFTRAALRRMFRTLVSKKQIEVNRQPALNLQR